jgi:hypothetical protein
VVANVVDATRGRRGFRTDEERAFEVIGRLQAAEDSGYPSG